MDLLNKIAGDDYSSGPYQVMFPAGETISSFDVPITIDNVVEDDETIDLTIQLTLPDGVSVSQPSQATITIVDTTRKLRILPCIIYCVVVLE